MNQIEIGKLIAKCRKEKKLTQTQLAEKLGITDRAVSKWETGKCMPDPSIMLELCGILGITANELLAGEKKEDAIYTPVIKQPESNIFRKGILLFFSASLLIGMLACILCDIAVSGSLTWSLIPAASIIFVWSIAFPGMASGKNRIAASLLSFSAFLFPYLFVLSRLIKVKAVFSIGAVMAAITIPFLWLIFLFFRRMGKTSRPAAFGAAFLLCIPLTLLLNAALWNILDTTFFDVWDALTIFALLLLSFFSFAWDHAKK